MKKQTLRLLPYGLLFALYSCSSDTEKVRPHLPGTEDVYCTYRVRTAAGSGPLKPGDVVCIYCAPPAAGHCALMAIEVAEGASYRLEPASGGCTDCPAGGTIYELLGD